MRNQQWRYRILRTALAAVTVAFVLGVTHAQAQEGSGAPEKPGGERGAGRTLRFLGGAAAALGAHESAHILADLSFGATPRLKRVDFHGIPFFAITPDGTLSRRQHFTIASAGFWVQHAGNEWILTSAPRLREQRAPVRKGLLAFNVLASAAYAGAAFARTGPMERDTRGMADNARMDERAIGALLLAPAVLDTVRYYNPDATWAAWVSRGVKLGLVLLVLR
jgi:hypothetical protein